MSDYILCHHGIKGQKWGVRRYQNPDGSLTAAGKRRTLNRKDRSMYDAASRILKEEKKYAKRRYEKHIRKSEKALEKYKKYDSKDTEYLKKMNEAEEGTKKRYKLEKKWDKYSDKTINYLEDSVVEFGKAKVEAEKYNHFSKKLHEVKELDIKPGKDYVAKYFVYYDGQMFYQNRQLNFTSEKGRA